MHADYTPEWYALLEQECGSIPEGALSEGDKKYMYYNRRYAEYSGGEFFPNWESAVYYSDEVFD